LINVYIRLLIVYIMSHNIRKCLACGEPLVGRSDKKFCSPQCKTYYHNQSPNRSEKIRRNLNSILNRNQSILKKYNPLGKTTVRTEVLKNEGFNFKFFTHIYKTKAGFTYYFCYDFGYMPVEDDKILIINWQDYMKDKILSVI